MVATNKNPVYCIKYKELIFQVAAKKLVKIAGPAI
jgi:hypothetical protein